MKGHGYICYVDFSGDTTRTACGRVPDLDRVTIYMSGPSCPECKAAVQELIDRLKPSRMDQAGGGSSGGSGEGSPAAMRLACGVINLKASQPSGSPPFE